MLDTRPSTHAERDVQITLSSKSMLVFVERCEIKWKSVQEGELYTSCSGPRSVTGVTLFCP